MRPVKPPRSFRPLELDWVVVSIEGLRRWGMLALFVVLAGALVAGAFLILHEPPLKRAQRLLQRASVAQEEVRRSGISEGLADEFEQASLLLEAAQRDFARTDYSAAAARAEEALRRFDLLSGLVNRELVGSGQIVALQGKVEVQRANGTRWDPAREKQRLYNGDFIKTSREGAADILFLDGTVYRVGPDSLLEVHRAGRSEREASGGEVKVRVGQVNVYTTTSPSLVLTDAARAEVERDSRLGVDVGSDATTVVSSYAGRARVTGASGDRIDLGAQQAVTASSQGALSARRAVPDVPTLEEPRANAVVDLDAGNRVELRWRPVASSTGYHLQVSRSRLFAPFNIEVEADRRVPNVASLQVLRPGTYYWRVAALGVEKVRSEWSPPRAFKAFSGPRVKELADTTPAKLDLQKPQQIGHFFLVQGVTEAGATVTINGETVEVAGDGTFKKAVVFSREGWNTIVVRATDPAGNTSEHRETVLVEVD
jgi:hypothetical protein